MATVFEQVFAIVQPRSEADFSGDRCLFSCANRWRCVAFCAHVELELHL